LDQAEVLGKRVVVQHIPLGGLLEWESSTSETRASGSHMVQYVTNVTGIDRIGHSSRSDSSGCRTWPITLNTVTDQPMPLNTLPFTPFTPAPVHYAPRVAANSNSKRDNADGTQYLPR